MLTHATFWTDLTKLSPEQKSETSWWIAWYTAHPSQLGPSVYELTGADPIDGKSWAAWQPPKTTNAPKKSPTRFTPYLYAPFPFSPENSSRPQRAHRSAFPSSTMRT